MKRAILALIVAALIMAPLATNARKTGDDPRAATPTLQTHLAPHNASCEERTLHAYNQCADQCGSYGILDFDSGSCGTNSRCTCNLREDLPGIYIFKR